MKLAEAWKILSSFFSRGNLYFQLHETNLNRKSVSEKWLESYWSTIQRYILLSVSMFAIHWMHRFLFLNKDSMWHGLPGRYISSSWKLHVMMKWARRTLKADVDFPQLVNSWQTDFIILWMLNTIIKIEFGKVQGLKT